MAHKYAFRDSAQLHFVSFATVNWIDVFVRRQYCDILVDSLKYCIEHKELELYAWCIMSSHVHLIISSEAANLSDIMRDVKRHTSKKILALIEDDIQESRREWMLWMFARAGERNSNNEKYQFWQQDNHPIELFTSEMVMQRLTYLHNNPVASGAVDEPQNYLYSSARDYCGEKGLLPLIMIS
jgi:putative transposase